MKAEEYLTKLKKRVIERLEDIHQPDDEDDIQMTWEEFYAQSQATGHWRGLSGRCQTCQG
jgi:hypothetical protein